jgi:hypothetical protein
VGVIERALVEEGPLTRPQLRERLDAAKVRTEGQALVHTIFLAALRGVCVRRPVVGKEQAFVRVEDWLGPQPEVDREAALPELARRYLVGHGPADAADLARWAGIRLGDARAGLAAIASELTERAAGLADLKRRPDPAPLPPPRLLGAFDPLLLGWTSREDVVGPHKILVTTNGIFRPFALVKGRAVATWKIDRGKVRIEHLGAVTKKAAGELEADGVAVVSYLGL